MGNVEQLCITVYSYLFMLKIWWHTCNQELFGWIQGKNVSQDALLFISTSFNVQWTLCTVYTIKDTLHTITYSKNERSKSKDLGWYEKRNCADFYGQLLFSIRSRVAMIKSLFLYLFSVLWNRMYLKIIVFTASINNNIYIYINSPCDANRW